MGLLRLFGALLVLAALVSGQGVRNAGEVQFLRKQAEALHAFAKFAFDKGFPTQARRIWQEVLKEYDPDHRATRAALGFRRVGTAWQEDESFGDFPFADNPRGNALKSVESRWDRTRRSVGLAHKAMAETFHAAGRSDRSKWHFSRALRFLPDDAGLRSASGMKSFYGLSGTELEQQLYERSKKMKDVVAAELRKSYAVEKLSGNEQFALLTKAGIPHTGYKTDHYSVWSDLNPVLVRDLGQNLERSRSFCSQIFTGATGFHPADLRTRNFIFLSSERLYKKTLRANKDLFRPEILDFLLKSTAICDIGKGANRAQLAGDPTPAVMRDLSIRWPVDAWGGMRSDAMNEGLGHAIVALFLGRITVYSMDLAEQGRTVTKRRPDRVLVPDVESWSAMAIETAFRARGVPLAKLPLISAASFDTDSRVRAWSFCDYLLRREPKLLLELDATRSAPNPPAVKGLFRKSTGIGLDTLEKEWRDFWTGATPVLRALRGGESPFGASSRDAQKWLAELNRLREQHRPRGARGSTDVKFHAGWSLNCKQHFEYLKQNRTARGPAAEHSQDQDLPGASTRGELFAQMALVSTKGSPKSATKDWIHLPGYRDAILNPNLVQVGIYAESGIAVIDAVRGVVPGGRSAAIVYPPPESTANPNSIAVADLGPEIEAILQGRKKGKRIGYPISVHAARGTAGSTCEVTIGGERVEGVVHHGSRGSNRRTSAPAMSVFYPFAPLKKGARVDVEWTLPSGRPLKWSFTVR